MDDFSFSTKENPIKFLVFDTNDLLLFLVRNESSPLGISVITVVLDFQVFLAQTIRLKKSNSKESERFRCCCSSTKRRNHINVEMTGSANEEQVFSLLEQSGVNNFALGERKIKKECPNFAFYIIEFQNSNIFPLASQRMTAIEKVYNPFSQEPMEISRKPHTLS